VRKTDNSASVRFFRGLFLSLSQNPERSGGMGPQPVGRKGLEGARSAPRPHGRGQSPGKPGFLRSKKCAHWRLCFPGTQIKNKGTDAPGGSFSFFPQTGPVGFLWALFFTWLPAAPRRRLSRRRRGPA
jgi:hypothetical protein